MAEEMGQAAVRSKGWGKTFLTKRHIWK
jgi:hypothetical protein